MADTTAPVPLALTISAATFTLMMTEADSPPVLKATTGILANGSNVIITSATVSGVNGTYAPITGVNATWNGAVQYTNGAYFLSYVQTTFTPGWAWIISPTVNPSTFSAASNRYYCSTGTTQSPGSSAVPLTGWLVGTAFASAFGSFGSTQGLSFSTTGNAAGQLSGGAVTVSNVTVSGTTITGTLSRAPASTETGNFLGAAGAFSDSASPPNATAAFSIPITASMFGTAARRLKILSSVY